MAWYLFDFGTKPICQIWRLHSRGRRQRRHGLRRDRVFKFEEEMGKARGERKEEEEKWGGIDFGKRIKFFIEVVFPYYFFYDNYIASKKFYHALRRLNRCRDFRGGAGEEKPQGTVRTFSKRWKTRSNTEKIDRQMDGQSFVEKL